MNRVLLKQKHFEVKFRNRSFFRSFDTPQYDKSRNSDIPDIPDILDIPAMTDVPLMQIFKIYMVRIPDLSHIHIS